MEFSHALADVSGVALFALGMAYAFVSADRESELSRIFAAGLACLGLALVFDVVAFPPPLFNAALVRAGAAAEALAMVLFLEWCLRVSRTVPARDRHSARDERLPRAGQACSVAYLIVALAYPDLRSRDFVGSLGILATLSYSGFWLFLVPVLLVSVFTVGSLAALLRRRPDRAERARLRALALAVPLLVLALLLPVPYGRVALALALLVILVGAVRYHVAQGQRATFLSRFLSPQVSAMVARLGLRNAMRTQAVELSVICCDLRGFTAYAQAQSPEYVVQLLRDYYKLVGQIAAEHDATIKDFAGDGALILVGAPIAVPAHAARALALAQKLGTATMALTRRWSISRQPLGVGLGVASGTVMVGVIASASRFEYAAIGQAVNIAARLCKRAASGELHAHSSTLERLSGAAASAVPAQQVVHLKGYADPVAYSVLRFAEGESFRTAAPRPGSPWRSETLPAPH